MGVQAAQAAARPPPGPPARPPPPKNRSDERTEPRGGLDAKICPVPDPVLGAQKLRPALVRIPDVGLGVLASTLSLVLLELWKCFLKISL